MPSEKKEVKLELAFPYDINIVPTVNGGCIVNVGCARLSYSTPASMLTDLKKYLADPQGHEKAYNECSKNRGAEVASETPRPSVIGSGRTHEEIPEQPKQPEAQENRRDPADHPDDRERREGSNAETEGGEDTEPG